MIHAEFDRAVVDGDADGETFGGCKDIDINEGGVRSTDAFGDRLESNERPSRSSEESLGDDMYLIEI